MPSLLMRLLLMFCCWYGIHAWAASPVSAEAIVLDDSTPSFELQSDLKTWIDESSRANIADVTEGASRSIDFQSNAALDPYPLNKFDTLWIKLTVKRQTGSTAQWTLNIPLPYLDSATVYQADSDGQWVGRSAGDKLSQSEWSRQGLYPDFEIQLPERKTRDIYLQIRNFKETGIPLRLSTTQHREKERQLELLGLGLMLGALLSLVALSVLRYAEHHKSLDGWAALFGLLIALTIGQLNGVMNAYVWAQLPEIGNYATGFLPVVAIGSALLFLRSVFGLHVHHRRFDRFLSTVGWGCMVSVILYAFVDRFIADRVCAMIMLFSATMGMVATVLSWRGGSSIGRWLMLALMPGFFAIVYWVCESVGYVAPFWQLRYIASLVVACSVPVLLYALSQLTHDRKELVVRAKHLPTQDALTGLLTPEVFQTHLETAVQRAIEHREPLALVLVNVTNHEHIRETYSDTTAEQCLLRAVVKLQRILRDVDPAGRVGTAQFAILLEGVSTREALTERMVKLVGSGLIPLPGLVPEVTLHFHAACVMLHDNPIPPERALDDLRELLSGMSPHTRRPIRFLEAVPTQASELHTPNGAA